jgi:hypothetical protein
MANVYLTEIPNAPGIQEMPLANYPDIPAIRHKPLDMTVDFSKEAASLQQEPLPGGFKRGSDIVAGALASGVRSAGVVGEGMQSVGNALSHAANVLFKLQENAVNDQDAVAGQKAHENRQIFQARFEAETAGMTMQEKLEWWNEHVGELAALNSTYGASRLTRDKIASSDNAFAQVGSYGIQKDAAIKESNDAINYSKDIISTALNDPSEENIAKAREANSNGHRRQWWNKETFELQEDKINRAAKIGFLDEKARDPASAAWVKEQSEKQQRGEKNDLYTKDDDPAMWNHAEDTATRTINETQRANQEHYHEVLTNDPSKITEADLKKEYNEGRLSFEQYSALETRRRGIPIPFDEGKVAEALSKATTYDRNADKDDKGRQSMKKYDEAVRYISENVPKELQGELFGLLKNNWDKTPDRSPQEQEKKLAHANVDELWESGLLPDPATKKPMPSGMDKGKIIPGHEEEYRTSNIRRAELHRMVEDYVNKHPDFTENELLDYIWGKAKSVVHSNVSAETAGVSTPLVSTDTGFYSNIGIPGRPVLQGELPKAKEVPVTEEEAAAAVKAVKEGKPVPTKALPSGPGAPVEITVYDRGERAFVQSRLAATPELLSVVEDASKIYDVILKSDEDSLRGRLGMVSGDALDPDMKEGIVREATKLSKEKGISLLDAGMEVVGGLKAQSEQDKIRIQEAIKNVSPTSAENVAAPSGVFQAKLAGTEPIFVASANKYGVPPDLLMAIAMHETGRGTSAMVRERNNPGGLYDSKNDRYMTFPTIEAGIDAMAKNLKKNYIDKGLTTIAQIQKEYAPVGAANDPKGQNKDWVAGVTAFRNQLAMTPTSGKVAQQAGGLDSRSAEQISTLLPQVQPVMTSFVQKVREWGAANGLEITVSEGARSAEKQAEYYAQGRTKPGPIITNAKPGQSKHQSAKAIDLLVTRNGKQVDDEKIWRQIGKIGKSMGLEWGGEWKSIHDPEHFQYNA